MVQKLLELGNEYAKRSTWKDYALVKFCLCAMGVLLGIHVPEGKKTKAGAAAAGIFAVTYIPLMAKVYQVYRRMK